MLLGGILLVLLLAICQARPYFPTHSFYEEKAAGFLDDFHFDGCDKSACLEGDMVGHGCEFGFCQLVCSNEVCSHHGKEVVMATSALSLQLKEISFLGCSKSFCSTESHQGYECQHGVCDIVCKEDVCWNSRISKQNKNNKSKLVSGVAFEGCMDVRCSERDYHGYGCKEGHCSLVCKKDTCHSNDQRYHVEVENKVDAKLVFEGCGEPSCKNKYASGFGCTYGLCDFICRKDICYPVQKSKPRQSYGKVKLIDEFVFEGCKEDTCKIREYNGHGCKYGHCDIVCKKNICYSDSKTYYIGKAKVEGELIFNGCFKSLCQNERSKGYNCNRGHCDFICEENTCYNMRKSKPVALKDKAKFVGEIVFEGCIEDQCNKQDSFGYGCSRGHCELTCKKHICYFKNKKYFIDVMGKTMLKGDPSFEGCHETSCQNERAIGYNCHRGTCDFICENATCYHVSKSETDQFKIKTSLAGDFIFEGCLRDHCKERTYQGYGCKHGKCDLVCKKQICFSDSQTYYLHRSEKDEDERVFEGCYKSSCRDESAIGYKCKRGHCDFICTRGSCHQMRRKLEPQQIERKTSFIGKFVFEGCMEEKCEKSNTHGYGCKYGDCDLVCKRNQCSTDDKIFYIDISAKARQIDELMFEGCFKSSCKTEYAQGYDCQRGDCKLVCQGHECFHVMKSEPRRFKVRAKVIGEINFDGCKNEKCKDREVYGFGCDNGKCDLVCQNDVCEDEKKTYRLDIDGKATLKAEINFDGCRNSVCKNEKAIGFGCKRSTCEFICEDDLCYRPNKSTKSESEEFIFTGCHEPRCQRAETFGYGCSDSFCEFVCKNQECHYKGNAMLPKDQQSKKVDIYFDGCLAETCFNEKFDGFACSRGKCALVCSDDVCMDAVGHEKIYAVKVEPTTAPSPESTFDYAKELEKIQFSKFFNFGNGAFF